MERSEFEKLVAEAVNSLPPEFLERLDNVDVIVEARPTQAQLARAGLPTNGLLFGLYEGIPLTRRTSHYGLVLPDKITIFQEPIEACYRTPSAIRRQVQRTVVHEIAHHFGISDRRLRELGW
ncbi:MAG: metallopeptidase family protein [Anaerolineae bacterium]|jgi:predicted Zn-dependent protease with MMP-like domain|nr:metallopeptidase family protein [Anaerolineae bacterium]MDH7472400.1 metallopeptidase family protein [Anaerolineae bacterium]